MLLLPLFLLLLATNLAARMTESPSARGVRRGEQGRSTIETLLADP